MVLQDDMHLSTWALACLLRLWSANAASGAAEHLSSGHEAAVPVCIDSMAPLYPSMRRLGGSLTSGKAASAAAGRVEGYAQLSAVLRSLTSGKLRLVPIKNPTVHETVGM